VTDASISSPLKVAIGMRGVTAIRIFPDIQLRETSALLIHGKVSKREDILRVSIRANRPPTSKSVKFFTTASLLFVGAPEKLIALIVRTFDQPSK
jgi:hypothetical protein